VKNRRTRRSPVERIRPFWMPIALCAALAIGLLAVAVAWPGFDPKRVTVSGNHRVSRHEILVRAGINARESIWLQNTGAMATRIATIPYVGTASVHRVPPATIAIAVDERIPFVIVRSGDEAALVDRTLRVLSPPPADSTLPVFVVAPGPLLDDGTFVKARDAIALRDAYDAVAAAKIVPAQLEFDRFGGLVVTLRNGLRLLLGSEKDLAQKLALVDPILSQVVGKQRRVAAIDLRAPATPVIVYR